ncbi:MAG: type II/IV secretion system ATPase subunit [Candidatus Aenigmarchaeota archaeon]|nr:type II/IV secretion system ATPase subunit [Candidatus Aenigmarchaeota archaeon]
MNLGKHTFRVMANGYRKKRLKEYYEESSKAQGPIEVGPGGQGRNIPIFIQPIVSPVQIPVNMRFSGNYPSAPYPQQPAQVQQQPVQMQQPVQVQQVLEKPEKRELIKNAVSIEGYEIPSMESKAKMSEVRQEMQPMKTLTYPLIPRNPTKGEPIMAYAKISWDAKTNSYKYEVVEPQITDNIKGVIAKVKELLEEKLDVDFSRLKISEATDYLRSEIDKLLDYYNFEITDMEKRILQYFIERDFMGLGKIEPIMHDIQIEDISCDGIGIPIFVFHRNPELGSIATNIIFYDGDELDSFITKLGQLTGKSLSVSEPLLDGALPDGSRLQATLATDIARKGSNFTIRKFSDEPITPIHLLKYGSVNVRNLAYLWMAVDYGRSILVSGGTASGKTSFLNAISLFIRPDKKIISIEDTAELRLPHPHWVPTVARTTVATSQNSNEIDMFALLKESLRQRPDYIIVGEVRGQEAFVLFQQMATGHPSYSTIHAENMDKLVDRLTTAPISLPKTLVGSLDLVIFLLRVRYRDKFVRRMNEVVEMVDFPQDADFPVTNTVFKWNSINDDVETASKSVLLKKITEATGMSEQDVFDEMRRRMIVLNWMLEKNITEYKNVYEVVNMYYHYPNRVLATITGGE